MPAARRSSGSRCSAGSSANGAGRSSTTCSRGWNRAALSTPQTSLAPARSSTSAPPTSTRRSAARASWAVPQTTSSPSRASAGSRAAATPRGIRSHSSRATSRCPPPAKASASAGAPGSSSSSSGAGRPRIALCHKLAAGEAHHAAVARVAAGDPDTVAPRQGTDEREAILSRAEDARPALRDLRRLPEQLGHEALEMALDERRNMLLGRVLVVRRLVAEAAGDGPSLRCLLPVVVAVPRVMRAGEQLPLERFGHEHLAARRRDGLVELRNQTLRIAVGGDHDLVGLELVE